MFNREHITLPILLPPSRHLTALPDTPDILSCHFLLIGEHPLMPPTGSSWIAVVRWRPVRRACRTETVPLAVELIKGSRCRG
jgi:hypothetical protein